MKGGRRAERERERHVLFEMRQDLFEKFPPDELADGETWRASKEASFTSRLGSNCVREQKCVWFTCFHFKRWRRGGPFQFEHKGEETDERRSPPTRINSKTKTETSPRDLSLHESHFTKFHDVEEKAVPTARRSFRRLHAAN